MSRYGNIATVEDRSVAEQVVPSKQGTNIESWLRKIGWALAFVGALMLAGGFIYGSFASDPSNRLKWVGHIAIPITTVSLISLGGVFMWLAGCLRNRRLRGPYDD